MQALSIHKINKYLTNIKNGLTSGLTKLFEYTYSNMRNVAVAYLNNESYADDVLSQAYENVVKYAHAFDASMNGYNWLYTIVKNCALKFNRREAKKLDSACAIDEKREDEFAVLDYVVLKDAIKTLNDYEKQLLYQLYWEGFTVKEISQKTGVPTTTIYSRIEGIYKKLRAFYKN